MTRTKNGRPRLPKWLNRRLPNPGETARVRNILRRHGLNTVCNGARCPNRAECFARGTATFMILGDVCTRACRFCAVKTGTPDPVRGDEPAALAEAAESMGLRHVVITSVTRDDLPDGGAGQFAACIRAVRKRLPDTAVEVLTPDFLGRLDLVDLVLEVRPDVFNHNVETVARLAPAVRPQADYRRSLRVLSRAAEREAGPSRALVKSGLMVGLGETDVEITGALRDLRHAGCELLTLGQYLAPSGEHVPVDRFVPPERFDAYREEALAMGFRAVAAGPMVRSSYRAEDVFASAEPLSPSSRPEGTGRSGPPARRP